jgi:hypothetical protein
MNYPPPLVAREDSEAPVADHNYLLLGNICVTLDDYGDEWCRHAGGTLLATLLMKVGVHGFSTCRGLGTRGFAE